MPRISAPPGVVRSTRAGPSSVPCCWAPRSPSVPRCSSAQPCSRAACSTPGTSTRAIRCTRFRWSKVTLPAQAYDAARAALFARSCATRSPRRASDRWEWRTQCRCSRQRSGPLSAGHRMPRPTRGASTSAPIPPELFTLLKIPVVAGRLFDERQTGEVVVNEAMARAFWPDSTGRRSAFDRWLANRGGGRRRPRRAADRSRRGRAGDVHAADVASADAAIPDAERRTARIRFAASLASWTRAPRSPSRRWPRRCGRR